MRLIANPRAQHGPYPDDLRAILSLAGARQARTGLSGWSQLSPLATPLWSLDALARRLGIGRLQVKDESQRSPLESFKVLGAPWALVRLVQRRWPDAGLTATALLRGDHAALLRGLTVISATDGNHGRALAAAARSLGCRCVIVLHAQVSPEREAPIAALGAEIVRIAGHYDDSVREAARLALANGWQVVSDTSWDGYEDIPRDVMQGYGVLAAEAIDQAAPAIAPADPARPTHSPQPPPSQCPWTHVILQGGVGGLAAGVASALWDAFGARRPRFIVVEPEQADCLLQSARLGRAASGTGTVDSVMAGLACGEASPLAWRVLQAAIDHFMTVPDESAVRAMQVLATGAGGDVPIVAGESGAAGVAALLELAADPALAAEVGLGPDARLLVINSEGATAPGLYAALAGRDAARVRALQTAWLSARSSATT